MPKSLKEMRSSDKVGPTERLYPICLAGKLVADIEKLEAELDLVEDRPSNGRLAGKAPRTKLEQQIEALRDEMNDHLAEVRFQAKPGHEYRAFVNAHPPAENDNADQRSGVSIDGFIRDMDEFVLTVNGDVLGPGDWEWIVATASDGDLRACCGLLMDMHNRAVSIPKSRLTSQTSQEPSIG